jgi:hypothetical protein
MDLDTLRPFASRIIAPAISILLAWLATKLGITFGADTEGHLTEFAVSIFLGVFLAVNGVIHKTLDKKLNPGDAASSHIAAQEKTESIVLKHKRGKSARM